MQRALINGSHTPFDEAQGRLRDGPKRRNLLRVKRDCLFEHNKRTARPSEERPPEERSVSKDSGRVLKGRFGENQQFLQRSLSTVVLAAAFGTLAQACARPSMPPPAVQAPKITFESTGYDFGAVDQATKVTHGFGFRNTGGLALKLDNVRASCGCAATASTAVAIPPGASGTVEVTCDTADTFGPQNKTVTVYSNDPAQPVGTLTLSGHVRAEAAADPPRVYAGHLSRGQTAANDVRILGDVAAAGRVETSGKSVEATLVDTPKGRRLRIAIKNDAPLGAFAEIATLPTGSPRHPLLTVPITGVVDGNVVVSPAQVNLGVGTVGEQISRVIGVQNRGQRPLRILAVRLRPAIGTAAVSPLATGQEFRITVTLQAGLHPGKISSTLEVDTDDPEQARIELPCLGRLVEKS